MYTTMFADRDYLGQLAAKEMWYNKWMYTQTCQVGSIVISYQSARQVGFTGRPVACGCGWVVRFAKELDLGACPKHFFLILFTPLALKSQQLFCCLSHTQPNNLPLPQPTNHDYQHYQHHCQCRPIATTTHYHHLC
jgi:hypothetical protein